MDINGIELGSKMELELYNINGEIIKPLLISQLEFADDETTAYLAAPIHEGVIYPVHIGTLMNVYTSLRADLYKFKARVTKRGIKDNIPFLKIEILSEFEKIQRREFFRFEHSVPIKYRVVDSLKREYGDDTPYKNTITRDLSGGGVCILLEERVDRDEYVECEIPIEKGRSIKFTALVVRLTKRKPDEKYIYEIGTIFKKIDFRDREALISFIFQEQRKLIKKGLIV